MVAVLPVLTITFMCQMSLGHAVSLPAARPHPGAARP